MDGASARVQTGTFVLVADAGDEEALAALTGLQQRLVGDASVAAVSTPVPARRRRRGHRPHPTTSPQDEGDRRPARPDRGDVVPRALDGGRRRRGRRGHRCERRPDPEHRRAVATSLLAVIALAFPSSCWPSSGRCRPAIKAAVLNLLSIAAYGVAAYAAWLVRTALRDHHSHTDPGVHPDDDVRDPLRPVDGLRGVPAVADPGSTGPATSGGGRRRRRPPPPKGHQRRRADRPPSSGRSSSTTSSSKIIGIGMAAAVIGRHRRPAAARPGDDGPSVTESGGCRPGSTAVPAGRRRPPEEELVSAS